jgi:hypothetical protein
MMMADEMQEAMYTRKTVGSNMAGMSATDIVLLYDALTLFRVLFCEASVRCHPQRDGWRALGVDVGRIGFLLAEYADFCIDCLLTLQ